MVRQCLLIRDFGWLGKMQKARVFSFIQYFRLEEDRPGLAVWAEDISDGGFMIV